MGTGKRRRLPAQARMGNRNATLFRMNMLKDQIKDLRTQVTGPQCPILTQINARTREVQECANLLNIERRATAKDQVTYSKYYTGRRRLPSSLTNRLACAEDKMAY